MSNLLLADDFVGLAETGSLSKFCYIIIANTGDFSQCEEMYNCSFFFKNGKVSSPQAHYHGGWVWGDEALPVLDSYCYLGIEFSSDGP